MYYFDYRAQFNITHPTNMLADFAGVLPQLPRVHIKRGDERRDKTGKLLGRKAKASYLSWRLHNEMEVSSKTRSIDKVLLMFFQRLNRKRQILKRLLLTGGSAAIEIALRPSNSYSVCILNPKLLRRFVELGVELDICVVVPPGRLH